MKIGPVVTNPENDIWQTVFYFLKPDLLINRVALVSKTWEKLASNSLLWKALFEKYFSRLPSANNLPINFKAAFKCEYAKLQDFLKAFLPRRAIKPSVLIPRPMKTFPHALGDKYLLSAVMGEFAEIEADKEITNKDPFYILALENGHIATWEKLKDPELSFPKYLELKLKKDLAEVVIDKIECLDSVSRSRLENTLAGMFGGGNPDADDVKFVDSFNFSEEETLAVIAWFKHNLGVEQLTMKRDHIVQSRASSFEDQIRQVIWIPGSHGHLYSYLQNGCQREKLSDDDFVVQYNKAKTLHFNKQTELEEKGDVEGLISAFNDFKLRKKTP